jgi:anaerobic magnesium-protoporphyrin IX monomethyl ester cyclase
MSVTPKLQATIMRPRVTLVNPPYPLSPHKHMPFPQLGLGYLAAVLEKNGYEVDVIDCQALFIHYDEYKKKISKSKPDLVGFTSITLTYKSALHLVKLTKEIHPKCVTVLGGPHATFWDEEALQECPDLDVVVRKEGEYTLLELVQRLEAGKNFDGVQGITYRKGDEIVVNPDRPYIEDLDSLPYPARHLWPVSKLRKVEDVFYLTTSRGCTSWCDFCQAVRMFGRRYRMRSPKGIVDELEYLNKKYNATQFTFCDDAFTIDPPRIEELCKEIMDRNLKIIWNCGTRVDKVTKELLIKMKEAGCVSVWFGVESGSQEVLDNMHKDISTSQTLRAVGWVQELGLQPVPNVLLGFPGETKETAWKTIKFVQELCPNNMAYFNVTTPLPGTPLYDKIKDNEWLRITDFNVYDCMTPVFETPTMNMEELAELYEKAFQRFYLRPLYILRMWRKGWTYGLSTTRYAFRYLVSAIKSKLRSL